MRPFDAVATGFARARSSPTLVLVLWLLVVAVALPFALVIREAVARSVGASRVHLELRQGFDMDWYSEYRHEAVGVERLLTPTSVRPAAFLDNLEAWWSGGLFTAHPAVVATGVAFALVWTLLAGGILHRYVFLEPDFSLRRLLAHGAELFPRFARLLALTGVLYFAIYRLGRWAFPLLDEAMRDVTVERTALAVHLAAALVLGLLLVLVKVSSDYAKVATVMVDRRSMLLALGHGAGFVLRHPVRTLGAYGLVALAALVTLGLLGWVAPGQGQAGPLAVLGTFLFGQVMLTVRLVERLTLYAAAVEIYRDALD